MKNVNTNPRFSRRAEAVTPFLAMEVFERAKALEAEGRDIVYLCVGEPDFPSPAVACEAAIRGIREGGTTYTHSLGLPELREAIAEHYARRYGVAVDPGRIIVSSGTSPLMFLLFSALLDKGDEILLADPCYSCYPNFIRFPGGNPCFLRTREEDGFQPRPEEVRRARESGFVHAVKYYPAGATTNSDSGVTDIARCFDTLEAMAEAGMPLLVHGEVTDAQVDVFDRERVFIERTLGMLVQRLPRLRIVLEHITTSEAVAFVRDAPDNVAATITAHHLLLNRNAMFAGGMRPHHYCLPVLKREEHREALVEAATSGNPKFFLGTDSAPHSRATKEAACGCAGIYSAHVAIELYAEAFEDAGALDRLEAFASFHGADFYGLPRHADTITLRRENQSIPASLKLGDVDLVPLRAGEAVRWRVVE